MSCQTMEKRTRSIIKIQDIQTYADFEAIEDEAWDGHSHKYAALNTGNAQELENRYTTLIHRENTKPLDDISRNITAKIWGSARAEVEGGSIASIKRTIRAPENMIKPSCLAALFYNDDADLKVKYRNT